MQHLFRLEGRVVPKQRPRVSNKRAYLPPAYRNWKDEAVNQLRITWAPNPPLESAAITIEFHGKMRGDIDNLAGSILDALVQSGVLVDDRLGCVNQLNVSYSAGKETYCAIAVEYH